jgi:ribosomal protein S18 acetylase RimI-like enzyme
MSNERATSQPGVTLRPARNSGPENDLEFLCRVYAAARAEELAVVPWSEAEKAAFLKSQFELQHDHYHSNYPDARYDLICEAGRPIGRYYVEPMQNEIRIMDIALLPEHRGRGIGRRLVQDVLDEAARSRRFVSLHVEAENPAKRLYERMGFAVVTDVGVYELMHWVPEGLTPVYPGGDSGSPVNPRGGGG